METKSLARLAQLHPLVRDKAIDAYNEAVRLTPKNVHPYITETLRSPQRSDELYKLGRTVVNPDGKSKKKPMGNIVSNSRAWQSYHNYGMALDFMLIIDGKDSWVVDKNWMLVVNIFKQHGFTSGLDWKKSKDAPHLEMRLGYSVKQLKALHDAGRFIEGTNYLQLNK